MISFGIATKISILLLLICVASVLCVLSLPVFESISSACKGIEDCDPFLPVCAAHTNEHQFFYSHCDMLREICMTGKDWKTDYLSHCNVSKL
ncbi:follistatin-related protein 1 [Drosophila innubila]|uniref:follistatin-related protein 1 n=1 Tax=Drosophila innubila TaxID=198719 RepID=UPI00148DACA0|nr:follistatin-related protein 1 [Drosophila innubila]